MVNISVVIPVRDEEKNLDELCSRIIDTMEKVNLLFEVIFVTDINKDNTLLGLVNWNLKDPRIKTIKLANSFGQHVAVFAGLKRCEGKYIVIMDGDLQDYPEDIEILYKEIVKGFDIVYAIKEKKNDSFLRNLCSKIFNSMMNKFSDSKIESNSSMFRIISDRAANEVLKFEEFEPSLTYIFSFIGLPTSVAMVRSGERKAGETKYNVIKLTNFAISSLLSFSRKPLRLISKLGLFVSVGSIFYLIFIIIQSMFLGIEVVGWATIISLISFFGGIQLLCTGIIGEYVGRIYMETKKRPLYVIEKKIGEFHVD